MADENTNAIELTAENVTLDLNGHFIFGPVSCTGTSATCLPASGTGIGVSALLGRNMIVRNGTIKGMGESGVSIGKDAHVGSITALSNEIFGISITSGTVANSLASGNGFTGITTSSGFSLVTGNTAIHNGGTGINVFEGTASNNTANGNANDGISCEGGSLVTDNSVSGNGSEGIKCDGPSTISNNRVTYNGSHGIDAGNSTISGDVASSNTGLGRRLYGSAGYSQNVLTGNNAGNANPQVSGGIETGVNVCATDTTCP